MARVAEDASTARLGAPHDPDLIDLLLAKRGQAPRHEDRQVLARRHQDRPRGGAALARHKGDDALARGEGAQDALPQGEFVLEGEVPAGKRKDDRSGGGRRPEGRPADQARTTG